MLDIMVAVLFWPMKKNYYFCGNNTKLTMAKLISADLTNNNLCILEYSTTDGIMLSINTHSFDANIEAHTYTDIGRIIFRTPITKIGDRAFSFCNSLASVTIPNSVTTIEEMAFYDCI